MAKLINAKCPNCGAILELPAKLDRAFCIHCGGKVIIAKDEVHHHGAKPAIACPECEGKGFFLCTNCDGDGICNDCGGNGICNWKITFNQKIALATAPISSSIFGSTDPSYFRPSNKIYSQCINGRCSHCNGTGKLSFWSGKMVWDKDGSCGACGGTGVCPQCGGTGVCPQCDGKGKCKCGGTGKIKCEACNGTGFKVYQGE